MNAAITACEELGNSLVSWGSSDFLVEVPDQEQLEILKRRLLPMGFRHRPNEDDEKAGVFEFAASSDESGLSRLENKSEFDDAAPVDHLVSAPLGVRVGPLFVACFFVIIGVWAIFQSDHYLRDRYWVYAGSFLMAALSIFSSLSAYFWTIEFSKESMTMNSLFTRKVITWDSVASVHEAPARVGRQLMNVVIKLRSGAEIKTRNFHFHFAHRLSSEMKRRLEIFRS